MISYGCVYVYVYVYVYVCICVYVFPAFLPGFTLLCRFCSLHADGVVNRSHNARAIKPYIKSVEISDDEDDIAASSPHRAHVVDLVTDDGADGHAEHEELLDSYVGRRGTSSSRTARPRRMAATPSQPTTSSSSTDKKKVIVCSM
jgi:hypothetical protein